MRQRAILSQEGRRLIAYLREIDFHHLVKSPCPGFVYLEPLTLYNLGLDLRQDSYALEKGAGKEKKIMGLYMQRVIVQRIDD